MWARIKFYLGIGLNKIKLSKDNTKTVDRAGVVTDISKPDYYLKAEKEIGVSETNNPKRVIEYHSKTSLKAKSVKTAWCSSFVCWCLGGGTNSAWARDYEKFGKKLVKPEPFCIIGFERNGPGGDSHVGFWTGKETSSHYEVLGGNQSNSVKKSWYSKEDYLYARKP